ncbi:MAG: DUF1540 domain-containing protein [Oscillospiraceae bacterium]|jgi:hypothetical protein|nr:DUF1540 domain-containing protein [Oscillospiraceae bacterium]
MTKQTNNSISCKVSNCTHYAEGKCDASRVNVLASEIAYGGGPVSVNSKLETCCDTFSAKN